MQNNQIIEMKNIPWNKKTQVRQFATFPTSFTYATIGNHHIVAARNQGLFFFSIEVY
jgi:hypothetical protein